MQQLPLGRARADVRSPLVGLICQPPDMTSAANINAAPANRAYANFHPSTSLRVTVVDWSNASVARRSPGRGLVPSLDTTTFSRLSTRVSPRSATTLPRKSRIPATESFRTPRSKTTTRGAAKRTWTVVPGPNGGGHARSVRVQLDAATTRSESKMARLTEWVTKIRVSLLPSEVNIWSGLTPQFCCERL